MQTLDLNGRWTLTQSGNKVNVPANVPGTVHLDLFTAGKIPDPYYRDNENDLQWIGETNWFYTRIFKVSREFLQHDRVLVHFDGLDTLAVITINSLEVARTDNMFRTYEFDAKPFLKPGNNTIKIKFESTIPYIKRHEIIRHLPAWKGVHDVQGGSWIRKEQCNFGWD